MTGIPYKGYQPLEYVEEGVKSLIPETVGSLQVTMVCLIVLTTITSAGQVTVGMLLPDVNSVAFSEISLKKKVVITTFHCIVHQ